MLKAYIALRNKLASKRGQNTVEYLLMLAAVVGLVIVIGGAMKGGLNDVWAQVKQKILGAVGQF
ncbi:MAG: class III signal peptide-containing protein [Elusimicrobia bacterium]|nr:class III signal peptide-containing protein [Elusimicrobiota bacterium]